MKMKSNLALYTSFFVIEFNPVNIDKQYLFEYEHVLHIDWRFVRWNWGNPGTLETGGSE